MFRSYVELAGSLAEKRIEITFEWEEGCDLDTDKRLSEQGSIPAAAAASVYVVALNVWPRMIRRLLLFIFGVLQRPLYLTCLLACVVEKKTVQN